MTSYEGPAPIVRVDGVAQHVIQAPKPELRIMRYELTDYEWSAIKPMLPKQAARRTAGK
jgi:hypothetical protein